MCVREREMPLFVDGTSLEGLSCGDAIYKKAIEQKGLADRTAALASSPVVELDSSTAVLYAGEKEVCTSVPSTSRFEWVATDDGTTCVMVAAWRRGAPLRGGIAHADNKATAIALEESLIAPLANSSSSSSSTATTDPNGKDNGDEGIDVFVAGGCWSHGFQSTCDTSCEMVFSVLEVLNSSRSKLNLRALLVLKDNPAKGLPLCMGLSLNVRTGEARRAHCVTHGPLFPLRYLRLMSTPSKSGLVSVYDADKDACVVLPLREDRILSCAKAKKLLSLSDEEIVSSSSSPECETPRFCSDTRSAAAAVSGDIDAHFPGGAPVYFDEKGNKI